MSGHHDGGAAGVDFAEQVHDVERQVRIEVARRLVGQHEHGVVHQRARNRDALLLAAGQLLRIRVHSVLQSDPLQHLKRLALLRGHGRAEHARHNRDILEDGLSRNELEILKDKAHRAPIGLHLPRAQARQIFSGNLQQPVARQAFSKAQAQKRGFAGAARPGQKHEFPLADVERQLAQRIDAAAVQLGQVPRFDHACSSSRRRRSFTSLGFALPPVAFITCPTRNPNVDVLPLRYCAIAS